MTEREIKASIEAGASTVAAVTRACCAGDDCGACHQTIEELLEEQTGERAAGQSAKPARVRERAA